MQMKNKKNEKIMHKCYYGIVAVIAHSVLKKLPFSSFTLSGRKFREEFIYPFRMLCSDEEASLSSR